MFCSAPFNYLEAFDGFVSCCCPGWMKPEAQYQGHDIAEAWHSELFQDIRKSMLENNPRYCKGICPFWPKAGNEMSRRGNSLLPELNVVRLSYDSTCNLHCRSCRDETRGTDQEAVKKNLDSLFKISNQVRRLELCGNGDPIASPTYRDFLLNFPQDKFENLHAIKLHTNAQLLTPGFYQKLPEFVQNKLTFLEVSIDAAKKETYEQIRRGGKWEVLQENLKYLIGLEKINSWEFDFCVQRLNYREIREFRDYIVYLFRNVSRKPNLIRICYQWMDWWDFAVSEESWLENTIDGDLEAVKEAVKDIKDLLTKDGMDGISIIATRYPEVKVDIKELKKWI